MLWVRMMISHIDYPMPRLIVHGFTISLDGYGAGPDQSLDAPMGTGRQGLHPSLLRLPTAGRHAVLPKDPCVKDDGDVGTDNDMAVVYTEPWQRISRARDRSVCWVGGWCDGPDTRTRYRHPR